MGEYLRVVPVRLQGPQWQTNPQRLIAEYESCIRENRDIPQWMFANTPQGCCNIDVIFTHVALNVWRLTIDRKSQRVDSRLKSGNQQHLFLGHIPKQWVVAIFGGGSNDWQQFFADPSQDYLEFRSGITEQEIRAAQVGLAQVNQMVDLLNYSERVSCGATNWRAFLLKHKLKAGMETHYDGSPLEAFLVNFDYAFHRSTWHSDLHYGDFNNFLATGGVGRATVLADHLLREEFGLVRKEGPHVIIDPRVCASNLTVLSKDLGFLGFTDLKRSTGIHSILQIIKETEGTWDGFLFWRYPEGFDPLNPHHIHRWDFYEVGSGRFPTLIDKANALLHIAEEMRMRIGQMYWRITPETLAKHNVPDVLGAGQSVRDIFAAHFAGQIKRSLFRPEAPFSGGRVELFDGTAFAFPQDLSGCFARRESSEHMMIYRMPTQDGASLVRRRIEKPIAKIRGQAPVRIRRVVTQLGVPGPMYAVFFNRPGILRAYTTDIFPDLSVMDPLAEELVAWKPGFSPLWLSITEQREVCRLYADDGFGKVQWYLKNRGILDRVGFRPGS